MRRREFNRHAALALGLGAAGSGLPAAAAAGAIPTEPPAERSPLDGTWLLCSYRVDGQEIRGADPHCTLTFAGDRWREVWRKDDGTDQVEQGTWRLIDGERSPQVAHWLHTDGPYRGSTTQAVYHLEGQRLKCCVLAPRSDAPAGAPLAVCCSTWRRGGE
jgi:uncharacterized protein (TIGR03067 family)